MESQNHYYGHSAAFARYLGMKAPRHIPGLVQHGWTAASPVETHFRDFPELARPQYSGPRRLYVWSHRSRAWDPASTGARTVPIGAPFLYEVAARRTPVSGGTGTVVFPVHGIETQALSGDHKAAARSWLEHEGPSTISIYWSDARDQRLVDAYLEAGHRCITLGRRTDTAFLPRLVTLLSRSARVVSNRLSTPIVYAAWLGRSVGVYGDPMLIETESLSAVEGLRRTWPEFYGYEPGSEEARETEGAEVGAEYRLDPDELRAALGWDRRRMGPFLSHWTTSPVERALINVRRRSAQPAAPSGGQATGLSLQWFRAATTYLPRPLGPVQPETAQPIELTGGQAGAGQL
jgi:hypothetical protein